MSGRANPNKKNMKAKFREKNRFWVRFRLVLPYTGKTSKYFPRILILDIRLAKNKDIFFLQINLFLVFASQ